MEAANDMLQRSIAQNKGNKGQMGVGVRRRVKQEGGEMLSIVGTGGDLS
jgi:hypothetical protein